MHISWNNFTVLYRRDDNQAVAEFFAMDTLKSWFTPDLSTRKYNEIDNSDLWLRNLLVKPEYEARFEEREESAVFSFLSKLPEINSGETPAPELARETIELRFEAQSKEQGLEKKTNVLDYFLHRANMHIAELEQV